MSRFALAPSRLWVSRFLALMILSASVQAEAASSYTLTDLGADISAGGMNASGQIIGTLHGGLKDVYFVTGANGVGMTDLGSFIPSAINDQGVMAGGVMNGSLSTAAIYQPGVGATLLAQPGWVLSWGRGISASGQVIGTYSKDYGAGGSAVGTSAGFVTGANGIGVQDWGAYPVAINASGQIVGSMAGRKHAVLTGPSGVGVTDLGALPSPVLSDPASFASAISGSGRVVGYSEFAQFHYPYSSSTYTTFRAYLTGDNGVGMVPLGELPMPSGSFGASYMALGVNNAGQVVGSYSYYDPNWVQVSRAFITGANGQGMTDLNGVIALGGGDYFTGAASLNERGQFLATSYLGHTYLIGTTAVPEVDISFMWTLGLLGLLAARSRGGVNLA